MKSLLVLLVLTGFVALTVAFLYQPKGAPQGRFAAIRRRIRIVAYAYVAAVIIRLILYYLAFNLDF
jgi:hypothetical protein